MGTMEQAVIVEGGVLTGEKIKIKNKTENSPFKNSSSSSNSETVQENTASSSNQYVPSSKRRHSAGSHLFPPRHGHHSRFQRGRSMSIRIGCSDVVNGLNKSNSGTDISRTSTAEAMEAEDSATVSSTISSDTEDDFNSSTE